MEARLPQVRTTECSPNDVGKPESLSNIIQRELVPTLIAAVDISSTLQYLTYRLIA
jgi:hypothetical protein